MCQYSLDHKQIHHHRLTLHQRIVTKVSFPLRNEFNNYFFSFIVSLKQLSLTGSTSSPYSSIRQNSTASQPCSTPPSRSITLSTRSPSIPSLKTSTSSLQITLTNDENDRSLSFASNLSHQSIQANTTVSVQGANRSAFRPVIKSVRFNQQPGVIQPRENH